MDISEYQKEVKVEFDDPKSSRARILESNEPCILSQKELQNHLSENKITLKNSIDVNMF